MGPIGEIANNTENWSPSSSSSVAESMKFYEDVMGFVLIKSPSSFDFEGAWLFNYGIGIHLLQSNNVPPKEEKINPKDNHISFQCTDMQLVMQKLEEKIIEHVTATVREGSITVDQLFHDPDGYMVEICICQNLPVLPLSSCPLKMPNANKTLTSSIYRKRGWEMQCSAEVTARLMENLLVDMFNISI